jgi:hypothetical protein
VINAGFPGAKQSLAGMQAMGTELQTKLLPGLAQMLHVSPQHVEGYLAANFPAVAGVSRRCRPRCADSTRW